MFLLVDPQVLLGREAFPAVLAGEGSLPRVDALVRLQVARLREALPALRAAVRPLACVHADVRLQAARRCEAFSAVVTGKSLVPAEPAELQWVESGAAKRQQHGAVRHRHHAGHRLAAPGGAGIQIHIAGDGPDQSRAPLQVRQSGQSCRSVSRPQQEAGPDVRCRQSAAVRLRGQVKVSRAALGNAGRARGRLPAAGAALVPTPHVRDLHPGWALLPHRETRFRFRT